MPVINLARLYDNRVAAIQQFHQDAGIPRAELDVSGGIDSCVMACLLVSALGADRVTFVHSRFSTSPEQTQRAHNLISGIGGRLVDADLGGVWTTVLAEMERALQGAGYDLAEIKTRTETDPTVLGSIRSCLRAPIGRGFNRLTGGGIRHGTGNEDEDRWLRFYQKGGDGEVDTNPIAMLSKGEVYQLACEAASRFPAAKEAIHATIRALPSPDLWGKGDAHNDEDELFSWTGARFTYSRVDPDTANYTSVGTIERVSRLLDRTGEVLFTSANEDIGDYLASTPCPEFHGLKVSSDEMRRMFTAARRVERITRHKANPNIPALGTRDALIGAGVLTNTLPSV